MTVQELKECLEFVNPYYSVQIAGDWPTVEDKAQVNNGRCSVTLPIRLDEEKISDYQYENEARVERAAYKHALEAFDKVFRLIPPGDKKLNQAVLDFIQHLECRASEGDWE